MLGGLGGLIGTALSIFGIAGFAAAGFQMGRVRDLRGDRDDRDERIAERDAQLLDARNQAAFVETQFKTMQADYEVVRKIANGEQFWPKFEEHNRQMLAALEAQKAILQDVNEGLQDVSAGVARIATDIIRRDRS